MTDRRGDPAWSPKTLLSFSFHSRVSPIGSGTGSAVSGFLIRQVDVSRRYRMGGIEYLMWALSADFPVGKNRGEPLRQHRFARARRPDHQNVIYSLTLPFSPGLVPPNNGIRAIQKSKKGEESKTCSSLSESDI